MKITGEQFKDIIFQELEGWNMVEENMTGQRRWVTEYEAIHLNENDGKYYGFYYDLPSVETAGDPSDTLPGDDDVIELYEMVQIKTTTLTWEKLV